MFYKYIFKWSLVLLIEVYLSSLSGSTPSNSMPKKHMLCPVQRFVLTADLGQGYKRNKSLLTVYTYLKTQCSLQLCVFLFFLQTQRFIYRSGEALHGERSHIEEKSSGCKHYTRQDCQTEYTESILQYYKPLYRLLFF